MSHLFCSMSKGENSLADKLAKLDSLLADQIAKMDRESLLNFAKSPVPRKNRMRVGIVIGLVAAALYVAGASLLGPNGYLIGAIAVPPILVTAIFALLIAMDAEGAITHLQAKIQALTELLNREAGK